MTIRLLGLVSLVSCLVSSAQAQLPSPQTAARPGRWVRVPRAAPQTAVREVAPPIEYVPAAPRQRILVEAAPRDVPPMAWRVAGVRTPLCGHLKVALGRHLIRKGSPRPVLELQEEPASEALMRVVCEQPVAAVAPAPAEDLVYVPDEQPVFAPRALAPPKTPPVSAPRAIAPPPPKVTPRKVAPRAVPSEQAEGDQAPAPPAVDAKEEGGTEAEPADPGN